MKAFTYSIVSLLLIAFIAAIAVGVYYAANYLWTFYAQLDFVTRVTLLSAMATILLAALVIAGAIRRFAAQLTPTALCAERLELYAKVLFSCQTALTEEPEVTDAESEDALEAFLSLYAELALIGGAEVIGAYSDLRCELLDRGRESQRLNELASKLIRKLRLDLGHRNSYEESKLNFGDLLGRGEAADGDPVEGLSQSRPA